ncbi:MAG: PAS domain S-box protein [Leptospiraceae bacterium]|nr:PAS domain S-box protein [Leptospiraceae bacterium]MCK6382360.1 PAS domain S-box protein [Leptospiraceae bacterium]NUM40700.1 PAS domain S-box protein [Leptospiraceae bacterium]
MIVNRDAILNFTSNSVIVIDTSDVILYWNPAAEKTFGWSNSEIIGKKIYTIIPPEFHEAHFIGRTRATAGEYRSIGKTLEVRGLHKEGYEFPIELTLSTWTDDEGTFFGGIIRNISERKFAEEKQNILVERMQALTNSAQDAIISIASDNKVLSWNNGAKKLFGYSEEEILGSEILKIIPKRFHDLHNNGIRRFLSTGIPSSIGKTVEVAGLHKDGHEFPIELTLSTWSEGNIKFFSGIIRDITERKKAEENQTIFMERLQAITSSAQDAIISIAKNNEVLSWNKGAVKMFGYSEEEIIGKEILVIIPERFRKFHNEGIQRFLKTKVPSSIGKTVEVAGLHKDGHEFPIELTLSTWNEGQVPFFAGIIRNISERKKIESELEKERKLLVTEKELSDKLILNILPEKIAHELRYTGQVIPQRHNDVTILFSDFVGFSRIASTMEPALLVGELNYYFNEFDKIIGKYRLEKIKTIGDSYMCAAGVPEENKGCAVDVVLAAIEMQRIVKKQTATKSEGLQWKLRIGINTGNVVAGVVGSKKFVYDIWGDSVNLASRIENSGEPDKICVSGSTRDRLGDLFEFEKRGSVFMKNMGEFDVFTIKNFHPKVSRDEKGSRPSREFYFSCKKLAKCESTSCAVSRLQ